MRLFGQPLNDAVAALETLVDAGLLVSPAPASYRLPGLLRLFAADCAHRQPGRGWSPRPGRAPGPG